MPYQFPQSLLFLAFVIEFHAFTTSYVKFVQFSEGPSAWTVRTYWILPGIIHVQKFDKLTSTPELPLSISHRILISNYKLPVPACGGGKLKSSVVNNFFKK